MTSAALALMLLAPATATAATPNLGASADTLSPVVGSGDYAAFVASITNNDTSTVSQLYLDDNGSSGGTFVYATPSQGTCNATGPLHCDLGQLKPGNTASVTVVFQADTLKPPTTTAKLYFNAIFNTTGLGSGSGDNSHGDAWTVDASATVKSDQDFGGRYVANIANTDLSIVENYQVLGPTNPHSTKAYAPTTGIYVTVEDVDCSSAGSDPILTALCASGFGQVSAVNVNNGVAVSGTPILHFTLQTYKTELAPGVNANNISVEHYWMDGDTLNSESITDTCTFSPGSTTPDSDSVPCLTVTKLGGKSLQIDVWTYHNGGFRLS